MSRATLVLAALLLTACSTTEWVNLGVTDDQARYDKQECRSQARAEANRVARQQPIAREDGLIGGQYDRNMAQFEIERMGTAVFARCMEGKGYSRQSTPFNPF